jgi:hypothetical protein
VAPLPWRHVVSLFGSYVDARADLNPIASDTDTTGKSHQLSLRYSVPLPMLNKLQHEFTVGFDYKVSNNDLEFGGDDVSNTDTDVLQFQAGYGLLLPDFLGQTTLSAEAFYSPGDLAGNNDDESFNALRLDAQADYFYTLQLMIMKHYFKIIMYLPSRTLYPKIGHDCLRPAKQYQNLVYHVGTQIIQYTCTRIWLFFPTIGLNEISEAVVVSFIFHQLSEEFIFNNFFKGQKVAMPPAVLKYAEQQTLLLRQRYQCLGLLYGSCEGFLYNNVLTSLQGLLRHFKMHVFRSVNNDQLDGFIR